MLESSWLYVTTKISNRSNRTRNPTTNSQYLNFFSFLNLLHWHWQTHIDETKKHICKTIYNSHIIRKILYNPHMSCRLLGQGGIINLRTRKSIQIRQLKKMPSERDLLKIYGFCTIAFLILSYKSFFCTNCNPKRENLYAVQCCQSNG
jgi:hypothetical protein